MGTKKKQAAAKTKEPQNKVTDEPRRKSIKVIIEAQAAEEPVKVAESAADPTLESAPAEAVTWPVQEEAPKAAEPAAADTASDSELEAALQELAEAVKDEPEASTAAVRSPRVPRRAKKMAISIFSLLILLLVGGAAYTLYTDQQPAKAIQASDAAAVATPKPLTPSKPAKSLPPSVSVTSFLTPVHKGDTTELYIHTVPTATCTIVVLYNNVQYKGSELGPKVADDFGNVSWTWLVGKGTPLGDWPVSVTCAYNGKTAVMQQTLSVF